MDLQRRLDDLPPDLESLYHKILDSIDPLYLEHASELFQFVHASRSNKVLFLSYGDDTHDAIKRHKVQPLSQEEASSRIDVMRRRVNSRCKGLLEITYEANPLKTPSASSSSCAQAPTIDATVGYLHKTVKHFVESRQIWDGLLAKTKGRYDTDIALCKAYVFQLKVTPHDLIGGTAFWDDVKLCLRYAHFASIKSASGDGQEKLVAILDQLSLTMAELKIRRQRKTGL